MLGDYLPKEFPSGNEGGLRTNKLRDIRLVEHRGAAASGTTSWMERPGFDWIS